MYDRPFFLKRVCLTLYQGVNLDELVPMPLKEGEQRTAILKEVWLSPQFAEELSEYDLSQMNHDKL
jgi:hypothetical protein